MVQLAYATPMVALRDGMLELFDAIVGALHWITDDSSAAGQEHDA